MARRRLSIPRLPSLTTDPVSLGDGDMWFNSTRNEVMLVENGVARGIVTTDEDDAYWATVMREAACPLRYASSSNTQTTATMVFSPAVLYKGDVIAQATQVSGPVAAATPTRHWIALYRARDGALLGQTADAATLAWAASTARKRAFTAPITITEDGLYYVATYIVAGTVPPLAGLPNASGSYAAVQALYPNSAKLGGLFALATTPTAPASLPAFTQGGSNRHWTLLAST